MKAKYLLFTISFAIASVIAGCGGGDTSPQNNIASASDAALSTGAITAFGSVFVNGQEYSTAGATVVDDDSDTTTTSTNGLEVGVVVDVKTGASDSKSILQASELHLHPLARGYIDASDTTAETLTVLGQTVQISSSTSFSDHRACVSASSNPCTAITSQSGLVVTSGSGSSAVPGSYVTVHGYLFQPGATGTAVNIVATLVSVGDAPTSTTHKVNFKAEGMVTDVTGNTLTIGVLGVDLSSANCIAGGANVDCSTAFSVGQVVSAFAATAPSLPATAFTADIARLVPRITVGVSGDTVDIEGAVSSVTTSPAAFVVRGINVDASTLPTDSSLPAVGDIVRVRGTVASDGQSITASRVKVLHAARSATYGFEDDVDLGSITAGTAANTYVLTILGQPITVTSATRLADRSTRQWASLNPVSNPFNIDTFQSYLTNSASQHLVVIAEADASGNLTALRLTIVPASTVAGVVGTVDGAPAAPPFNSSVTGTPSTLTVHGVPVSADPTAVLQARGANPATVAAGDLVVALGTFLNDTLIVNATPRRTNEVVDLGAPQSPVDCDRF